MRLLRTSRVLRDCVPVPRSRPPLGPKPGPIRRRRFRPDRGESLLTIGPVGVPLLVALASAAASSTSEPAKEESGNGFQLTTVHVATAAALLACVTTVYAVRTYYARRNERKADEKSTNQFELAKAYRAASAELDAYQSAIADTDSALERLQSIRRGNNISERRELRLQRGAFAGDERMLDTYQRLLKRFLSVVDASHGHVRALRELVPLAAAHRPNIITTELLDHLVAADVSIQRILRDKQILLEDVEASVAEMMKSAFTTPEPRRGNPEDLPPV
jgi:hypothetical protein